MSVPKKGEGRLPLDGVAILEVSRNAAGAYCTRLLAALGADVIKVEPPGQGDPLRSEVLFPGEDPVLEKGSTHLHADLSKKSITLDISDIAGRQILGKLAGQSDVVVETLGRKERQQVGLEYEGLRAVNAELILTSISGFGDTGPYADYRITEGVAMAVGGMTVLTGDRAEPPLQLAGNTGLYAAGEYAAVATVAARYASRLSGHGQHIKVSIAGAVTSITEIASHRMIIEGKPQERTGNWQGPARGIFPCRDGYIGVVLRSQEALKRVADWLGMGDIVAERYGAFLKNQELETIFKRS